MSFHRRRREIHRLRSFFDGKTAEKSQLDNAALLRIKFGQFVQSVVESDHVDAPGLERQSVIQRQSVASIPLGGIAAARVLDQNLPHQLGADGQEMLAVLELSCPLFLQAQIRLVHQGGALQSVVRAFVPQVMMRHPPQLVIDERKHLTQRLVVTGVPVRQ